MSYKKVSIYEKSCMIKKTLQNSASGDRAEDSCVFTVHLEVFRTLLETFQSSFRTGKSALFARILGVGTLPI